MREELSAETGYHSYPELMPWRWKRCGTARKSHLVELNHVMVFPPALRFFSLDSQFHNTLHIHIHVFCVARKNYDINTRHTRFVSREEGDL